MKLKFASLNSAFPSLRTSLTVCLSLAAVADLHAASATWLAAPVSADWADPLNWSAGGPPGATTGTTNTDTATFPTSTGVAVTVDAGRNLQNISFTANIPYTLSGAALLLTDGGTLLSNGSAGEPRITAALQLQGDGGTYKIQTDTPGTNREIIISAGGITGVATGTNNTALTLTGTSGGNNAITGVIGNGTGGGTLSVVKEGGGLWILSAGNTYTGGTTVSAGTLRTDNSGNSSAIFGGAITMNGGTLRFQSTTAANFNNSITTTTNGGFISFRANSTFNPPAITGTGTLTLTADANLTVTSANFQNFAGTLNLGTGATNFFRLGSGYSETSLAGAAVNLAAGAQITHQSGTSVTTTTQIGTLSGAAGSVIGGSGSGGGTFVFSVGSRNEPSTFSGTLTNGGTKTGLTKVGTAKLTLDGTNTYTGTTTVNGGILSISSPYLANAAAVTIATDAVMDLNFSGNDFVGPLTLGGILVPDGVYNSSTPIYGVFFTGTGSLQVGATGYSTWSGINAGSQAANLDFDKDGVTNGVEFFFGATGSTFTSNPGIVAGSVTWPKSASFTGTYKIETSPDLVIWTDVTGSAVDDGASVTYTLPTGQPKLFVRLTVVPN